MAYRKVLSLAKRFVKAARERGLRDALAQTIGFVARRLRGRGRSALFHSPERPQAAERYLHRVWSTLSREEAFHIAQSPSVLRNRRQIAMVADLNLPQCRKYRVDQLAAFWRARDVEFEYAHYADIPRATGIMQHATHLMEYRLRATPTAEMLRYEAHRLRLPILYDIDDPLFSVPAYETYRNMEAVDPALKEHFLAEAPKYLTMMNGADVMSVSTPGLAAHTRQFTNRPVYMRRNFADAETLEHGAIARRRVSAPDTCFRVAFSSGSQGHEADLKTIIDPLADFLAADTERRLMLIGHFDLAHLPRRILPQVETVKFSDYPTYLAALARADCAVMPLYVDTFNSCKSAVRVIDACAVGVPAIVSPVGDLPAVVRENETGYVANTAAEWVEALRRMAAHPDEAGAMGRQARQKLEERWQASTASHVIQAELIEWVEA